MRDKRIYGPEENKNTAPYVWLVRLVMARPARGMYESTQRNSGELDLFFLVF